MSDRWGLLLEADRVARSQPVATALTIVVFAAMVSGVVLTNGKAVGAQREAVADLGSVHSRTITVKLDPTLGVNADILRTLETVDGIEWAGAFGPVIDVHNGQIRDGTRIGLRTLWSRAPTLVGLPQHPRPGIVVSPTAQRSLGLVYATGHVSTEDGLTFDVVGDMPDVTALRDLEPLAVNYQGRRGTAPVSLLIIVTDKAGVVRPIADTLAVLLPTLDPQRVTISADDSVIGLQQQVEREFSTLGGGLVLTVLITSGSLVSTLLCGLVLMRRKDFGRRRALGASRSWIIRLIVTQTVTCCLAGAGLGTATSAVALTIMDDPVPRPLYFVAVVALATLVAGLSSVGPALLAASRDPIRELRVP